MDILSSEFTNIPAIEIILPWLVEADCDSKSIIAIFFIN